MEKIKKDGEEYPISPISEYKLKKFLDAVSDKWEATRTQRLKEFGKILGIDVGPDSYT